MLRCKVGALKVVGLTALDAGGGAASPAAQTCPHLTSLLLTVRSRCDGHQSCVIKAEEIVLMKKQCPGVSSVHFRVNCIKPDDGRYYVPSRTHAHTHTHTLE